MWLSAAIESRSDAVPTRTSTTASASSASVPRTANTPPRPKPRSNSAHATLSSSTWSTVKRSAPSATSTGANSENSSATTLLGSGTPGSKATPCAGTKPTPSDVLPHMTPTARAPRRATKPENPCDKRRRNAASQAAGSRWLDGSGTPRSRTMRCSRAINAATSSTMFGDRTSIRIRPPLITSPWPTDQVAFAPAQCRTIGSASGHPEWGCPHRVGELRGSSGMS